MYKNKIFFFMQKERQEKMHGWNEDNKQPREDGVYVEQSKANLQIYSDCPADWCKCECHPLSPEEEEAPSQSKQQRKRCVSTERERFTVHH